MKKTILFAFSAVLAGGCVVVPTYEVYRPAPAPPPPEPEVVVAGPVFEAPGVEVIAVEPEPVERVYVYDPGYPPGCYFYGGYYWYGGYRYPHDVFIQRYVTVNVHENRFINVEDNRRQGVRIEEQHRADFAQNHGVPQQHPTTPDAQRQAAGNQYLAQQRAEAAQHQAMQQRTAAQQRTSAQHMDHY